MAWLFKYLNSSIGKKQIVAVTGMMMFGWLFLHMVGNIPMLFDPDGFNQYAYFLHSQKGMLYPMRLVMGITLLLHFGLAIRLVVENRKARGRTPYAVKARKGDKPLNAYLMSYSGIWILLFLISHITTFKFAEYEMIVIDGVEMRNVHRNVMAHFSNFWYSLWYVLSMFALSMHLSHGLGSVLQTFGLNHEKYNKLIWISSKAFAFILAGGFAALAIGGYFYQGAY
jgi:succinate dehydrogenase / fumarate reductase, cytochrome b subunit